LAFLSELKTKTDYSFSVRLRDPDVRELFEKILQVSQRRSPLVPRQGLRQEWKTQGCKNHTSQSPKGCSTSKLLHEINFINVLRTAFSPKA